MWEKFNISCRFNVFFLKRRNQNKKKPEYIIHNIYIPLQRKAKESHKFRYLE